TKEYIEAIIDGMKWLGLDWDEGPFRQTERFDIYRAYGEKLLSEGKAYRCYCTPEELEIRRQETIEQGKSYKYDGRCRDIKDQIDKPFVLRFKMKQTGTTIINDLIKGPVHYDNSQLDDLIIIRSDNTPTYNFCVVVDDVDMKITHVIRGDDHLNNTPKQIQIYQALGWTSPQFAHLPMILGSDKTRLSKRHGATSVIAYKDLGYLPEALLNYLARLGWSHGDQEIFSLQELIELFNFENLGKSAAIFNPEKLLWLNSQYIMKMRPEDIALRVIPFLKNDGINTDNIDIKWLVRLIILLQERAKTLLEMSKSIKIYIEDNYQIDEKARQKFLNPQGIANLTEMVQELDKLLPFTAESIGSLFKEFSETRGIKLKDIAQTVRVALTGSTASPGLFEIIELLGKERTLKRLKSVLGGIF
ncbi:MAG TPA: glutamate--tRNA ligase, partial [Nitrospirae bacterium]|nr:glutamate--tRNA ligase [Nitrospirota bacterium]